MEAPHPPSPATAPHTAHRLALLVLLSWVATLGFDFFLHAGVLAPLYLQPSPFLLPAQQAFQRIPLGYASLLLLDIFLLWLLVRLRLQGRRGGAVFGIQVGVFVWGSDPGVAVDLNGKRMAPAGMVAGSNA